MARGWCSEDGRLNAGLDVEPEGWIIFGREESSESP